MTAAPTPEMLIEAYVAEVVRRLPARQRGDVGHELHALLSDDLSGRAREAGRPADEAMALDLIRSFGKPDDIAARYTDTPAVIIPAAQARGFFWATVIGVGLQWAGSLPAALSDGASKIGVWWITGGLGALWWPGFLVVIATIAALVRRRWPAAEWSPRTLDRDRINRPIFSLGIAAALAGIAVWVASAWASATSTGPFGRVMAFSGDFLATRAPVVLLFWAGCIALLLMVLIEGRWRPLTRRLQLASDIAALALLAWFLVGGPMFVAAQTDAIARAAVGFVALIVLAGLAVRLWRNRGHVHPPRALTPPTR